MEEYECDRSMSEDGKPDWSCNLKGSRLEVDRNPEGFNTEKQAIRHGGVLADIELYIP